MKKMFRLAAWAVCSAVIGIGQASAVELLTSGDFETPGGIGDVPGWTLDEFVTGSPTDLNTAQTIDFDPFMGDLDLWLRSFSGGDDPGPDNLTNAVLSQVVPANAGEIYTFSGHSRWELGYSGGVDTLGAGPLSGQPSPTETRMILEFLDSGGSVISAPSVDLRDEQNNFDFWVQHTITETAPAGTTGIRVTAEARDMVSNPIVNDQSAFYDTFSLTAASDPEAEILSNPDLEELPPSALDFWTLTENPATRDEILRTANFANHTPGGTLGVWLSSFFGQSAQFEPEPVDGTMSQTVEAVGGGSYTFSGWTRFEPNYSGGVDTIDPTNPDGNGGQPSPTQTLLELAFLDADGMVIGDPDVLDLKNDRRIQSPTANANDNEWYQHTIGGVAPMDAVSVRVSGKMVDGVFNTDPPGQSVFFDDFSLDGPLANGIACDLSGDGFCGLADINLLYDEIFAGTNGADFDFDGNGVVNNDDIPGWLGAAGTENGETYLAGDTDLDGEVGGNDFTQLALDFGNEDADPAVAAAYWGNGNFDGNGTNGLFAVGGPDFTQLALNFGFVSVASVPEPSTSALLTLGLLLFYRIRRKYSE